MLFTKRFLYISVVVPCVLGMALPVYAQSSTCYGDTHRGRLEGGVRLPVSGKNFVSYSPLMSTMGRTYVHSTVNRIIVDSYQQLAVLMPGKVFKYAETGWKSGGRFRPHRTHQNGLSVDFMVPVMNAQNLSVHLPTYAANRFGYDIEFNGQGRYKDYRIDFVAMAAHIDSLQQAAQKLGTRIRRVIFAPGLQPLLFKTPLGERLKQQITFSKKPAWVRHDEHYHVDFAVECRALNSSV